MIEYTQVIHSTHRRRRWTVIEKQKIIEETYIEPLYLSLRKVAVELDVAASTFSRLIKGESDLTP